MERKIKQSELTCECWSIQCWGLDACKNCGGTGTVFGYYKSQKEIQECEECGGCGYSLEKVK